PETTSEDHADGEQPIKRRYSVPFNPTTPVKLNRDYFLYLLHSVQFSKHLDEILPDRPQEVPEVGRIVNVDLGRLKWEPPKDVSSNELVVVANLLASRVFYDFCRDAYWCNAVKQKIQSKLATLHLPYFIETLELSGFDIGTAIPKIRKIYAPVVDEWGLWIDFEMHYEGCIKLTLETRVNLMKLKEQHDSSTDLSAAAAVASSLPSSMTAIRVSRLSDDEAEISPETSPDEDFGSKIKLSDNGHTKKKKTGEKLLSLVDKIAQSNFFREASELRPIRKMLEEISSTRLILNVEVTALEGPATINLPPPPSDRLWYGFRKPPTRMSVRAVPQVGDRSVVFSTLSEWIESKIVLLFEKNLVMPNLDDIVVPVMCGNELLQGSINR
ncbi:Protein F55C12.5 a, partial [Aphelenchoides avenae]